MRSLLLALLAALGLAMPVKATTTPYLTLDTPPPYHYGGTIEVTTHGDIRHTSRLQMFCYQSGTLVYIESVDASVSEVTHTLHFGQWGLSQWDLNGGGPADCQIRFGRTAQNGQPPFERYTVIDIHVDA
jgi:hypothetical protein